MARFVYDCPVRWSDLDSFQHVNNARFLTLYEETRVALFFTAAKERGLSSFADGVVVARHEIDYLRPVDYGRGGTDAARTPGGGPNGAETVDDGTLFLRAPSSPSVRIELWVGEIRNSSFVVDYELFDEGVVASRAKSVLVPYDLAAGRPRRVSDAEREFLAAWVA